MDSWNKNFGVKRAPDTVQDMEMIRIIDLLKTIS